MIKVIISHDVDHLFARDHWLRDLTYPKLWIRTSLQLLQRTISFKEWWLRCISCFHHKQNHIDEVIRFDRENGVPSTFFFGMNQGLGLSYKPEEAKDSILKVHNAGFDIGVHGICYDSLEGIQREYDTFTRIVGFEPNGIRMHYVRYNKDTFSNESAAGYHFDSTEFDKETYGTRKDPYKVGSMWEFPLAIMDGYLPGQLEPMKKATVQLLKECEEKRLNYVTILFHDCYFCNVYTALSGWYKWLIHYISDRDDYHFISFMEAIEIQENQEAEE